MGEGSVMKVNIEPNSESTVFVKGYTGFGLKGCRVQITH